jgi:hypothetical protein
MLLQNLKLTFNHVVSGSCWSAIGFKRRLVLLGLAIFTMVNCYLVYGDSEFTKEDLSKLLPDLRKAENREVKLRIDSEIWKDVRDKIDQDWERTPENLVGTSYLTGPGKGKSRVDVAREVLQWKREEGPSYIESRYSLSFDGRDGKMVVYITGNKSGRSEGVGEIVSGKPEKMKSSEIQYLTGSRFSIHFFFSLDKDIHSFSNFIEKDLSTPGPVPVHYYREKYLDSECLCIAAADTKGNRVSYWLDLSRNFALRGYELVNGLKDGSEWIVDSIKVTVLKEIEPGLWFPMEATKESSPARPGRPFVRFVYRAGRVVANPPDLSESIFDVDIPKDYQVKDKRIDIPSQNQTSPQGVDSVR